MIEVLLTAIPSLCWIMYRCFQLLKTPSSTLMQQLNVDIPRLPSLCVDSLSPSKVSLHWDMDRSADESIFFVVLVNGKDAGTLTNTSVTLSDLQPDKVYQLQILAINVITNFRSQSSAIFVRTPPVHDPQLTSLEAEPGKLKAETLTGHVPLPAASELHPADVMEIDSESTLMSHLFSLQMELTRVTNEFSSVSKIHQQEEAELKQELQTYRKELNDGSDTRLKKGTDLRDLEKQKDSLTFTKLKLSKQLKNIHNHLNIRLGEMENLRSNVAKLTEKKNVVAKSVEAERMKHALSADDIYMEMDRMKSNIYTLEDAVKTLSANRKELRSVVESLKSLVNTFVGAHHSNGDATPGSMITRDGTVSEQGAQLLREMFLLKNDWEADITNELNVLAELERTWRSKFRACIKRYTSLYNQLEIVKANSDLSYEPRHISEHQASVNLAGHANAIKPKKKMHFLQEAASLPQSPMREQSYDDLQNMSYGDLADTSSVSGHMDHNLSFGNDPSVSLEAFNNTYTRPENTYGVPEDTYPYKTDSPDLLNERNFEHTPLSHPKFNVFSQNPSQTHSFQDLGQQNVPYTNEQVFGNEQVYNTPMAISPPTYGTGNTLHPFMTDYQSGTPLTASDSQLPIPIPPIQSTSDIRRSLEQPQYISPNEGGFIHPQAQHQGPLQSMWANTSQSSLFEGRRPYVGLSMSPSVNVDSIHMPMSQNLHSDSGLFNNLMVPSSTSLSKSIWSDAPVNTSYSHNRTVSGGSQLWRERKERSPTVGFSGDFTPFSPGAANQSKDEIDFNDIRSL